MWCLRLEFLFLLLPFTNGKVVVMNLEKVTVSRENTKSDSNSPVVGNDVMNRDPFTNYYDEYYRGKITLGTPPQTFSMLMDTGTTDFWVVGSNCQGCYSNLSDFRRTSFDKDKSTTFRNLNTGFGYSSNPWYNPTWASGNYGSDTLSFAGFTINQTFGIATQISPGYGNQPIDGVFGMGLPKSDNNDATLPIQQILGQLDSPVFTVFMALNNDVAASRITYGGLDNDYCSPDIAYSYVSDSNPPYWQFYTEGFSINNMIACGYEAIADTGSPYIVMSYANLNIALQQIGAYLKDEKTGLYTVGDYQRDNLPSLIFNINGQLFDVPPQEYTIYLGLDFQRYALALVAMSSNGFSADFILGTPFIRSWCLVHDIGRRRIGFALAKNRPQEGNKSGFIFVLAHVILMLVYFVY